MLVPAQAEAGDTVQMTIKVEMLENWHIYAYDPTWVFKVTDTY